MALGLVVVVYSGLAWLPRWMENSQTKNGKMQSSLDQKVLCTLLVGVDSIALLMVPCRCHMLSSSPSGHLGE